MTKRALRLSASAIVLAASFAVSNLARAADVDPAADQPVSTASATTVAPVTITAERTTENLQTTPLAATVLKGNQLLDSGVNFLDQLQFHTPSLTITDDGGAVLFNIRGLGKDLNNVQTPSGVVTYWDGVASFPGFFLNEPYYDISNIEVLRGPQGTFAGQNADAGAVFITTNDPRLGGFSGDVMGQYGSYNSAIVRGYVNLPINSTLAMRIAFDGERSDSVYKVSGPWTTPSGRPPGALLQGAARLSLLWQPTDSFRAVFKAEYFYSDTSGVPSDPSLVLDPTSPLGEGVNHGDLFHVTEDQSSYATDKILRLSLNASYTLPDGITLKSVSAYQYGLGFESAPLNAVGDGSTGFGFAPPYLDYFADYGREYIGSQELDAVSPDKGPLRWVGGLNYQHDYVSLLPGPQNTGFDIHLVFPTPTALGGNTEDIELHYRTPKTTKAVFGQVSYDLTPALQLQVGARFSHESFSLQDDLPTLFDGVLIPNLVNGVPVLDPSFNAHTSNSGVTGKVALNWKVDASNFLYAFVATGRKAAGINTNPVGTQITPVPFAPETVTDYEIGWKPTFFDGHLRGQLDAYYDQYQHFQLSFATPNTAGSQAFIRNVGGTTVLYGVEAEAEAVFGPLSFDAGGSYEHSRLGSSAPLADPGPSLTVGQLIQIGGRTVPLAPTWTFNAGGQYAFPLGNGATLTPRVDYSYTSGQWDTPYQDLGDFLGARSLVNAEIAYAQNRFKLTLFATNAFNLHYLVGTFGGQRYAGPPGVYGVRLEGRF